MSEQHPTPWGVSEKTGLLIDANGQSVIGSPDIQRRIVACVNACEGVSTEDLESFNRPADLAWVLTLQETANQRDELLAALKTIGKQLNDAGFNIGGPIESCDAANNPDEAKALLMLATEYFKEIARVQAAAIAEAKS